MKLAYLAFSDNGYELAQKLASELGGEAFRSGRPLGMAEWTKAHFAAEDGLVFVGSAGIAVRAIAPFIKDKTTDPAVVVIDERGLNVIPILSGHLGGANDLARRIASVTGAHCVITTATDINGIFAVDEWSKHQSCRLLEPERIVNISGALLGGGRVTVKSRWEIEGNVPEGITVLRSMEGVSADSPIGTETDAEVIRSSSATAGEASADITLDAFSKDEDTLHLVPPVCVLGIGCRKGTDKEAIELLLQKLIKETGLRPESICGAASIDLKKEEDGLLSFCRDHGWEIKFYASEELAAVPGEFSASEMVKSVTGVDNVCERSAALRAGEICSMRADEGAANGVVPGEGGSIVTEISGHEGTADGVVPGEIIIKKMSGGGVTMAVAMREYKPNWEWKNE